MTASSLQVSLSPGFTVNDLQKSIHFYTEGLGFEIGERYEIEGVLRYVSVKAGSAEIGLGQDDFAKGRDRSKGIGFRLMISTTQDIPALAARAKAAGITLDGDPAPLPWGPMAFAVTDPDGFKLTIASEA
jgi:lactoylglutathione lyase